MERNAILATALVILILVGYQWYLAHFEPPPQDVPQPSIVQPNSPANSSANQGAPAVAAKPLAATKPPASKEFTPTAQLSPAKRDIVVDTPLIHVTLTTVGARVTSWQLKQYRSGDGALVDLIALKNPESFPSPLSAWTSTETEKNEAEATFECNCEDITLKVGDKPQALLFTYIGRSGIEIQKRLTFHADQYEADVDLGVRNLSGSLVSVEPRLAWGPGLRNSIDKKQSTLQPPTLWLEGKRVHEDLAKVNGGKVETGTPSWIALQDSYFAVALVPDQKGLSGFVSKAADDQPVVGLVSSRVPLQANGETTFKASVFGGPKDLDVLKRAGHDLDQLVDLGIFDRLYLVTAALWLLKLLYRFTGNYGVAIILVTVLQKIVFHPLTVKSLRSMRAMQEIQPKVLAIQERYKNNPQKKQEETMALYRKNGVNPMGGCLPMLVQIPIFIALYNALSSSVEMWQARFLWIPDLTQPDSLFTITLWGGHSYPFNLLGLLMGVSMWVQQKMSPPAGDPRQAQLMLWMMPILFTFMFWSFPSGLVLYWLVNNILQIGQQWLITRTSIRASPAEGQAV